MTDDARVVKADFVDYKTVRTRSVLQIVLEVKIEDQAEIFARLGYPLPGQNKWVAVALLDDLVASETNGGAERRNVSVKRLPDAPLSDGHHTTRSLAGKERYAQMTPEEQAVADAGRLAKDPRFIAWADTVSESWIQDELAAAEYIRQRCDIGTRRDIATNPRAYAAFAGLVAEYRMDTGLMAENRG